MRKNIHRVAAAALIVGLIVAAVPRIYAARPVESVMYYDQQGNLRNLTLADVEAYDVKTLKAVLAQVAETPDVERQKGFDDSRIAKWASDVAEQLEGFRKHFDSSQRRPLKGDVFTNEYSVRESEIGRIVKDYRIRHQKALMLRDLSSQLRERVKSYEEGAK